MLISNTDNLNERKGPKALAKRTKCSIGRDGFSLLEVLIALTLAVLAVVTVIGGRSLNSRTELDKALSDMEAAVRFAADEAILRGSIVRLFINFDSDPQEYTVEFGPPGRFVIPKSFLSNDENEEENKSEDSKKIDKSFSPVPELEDGPKQLPKSIRIIGASSSLLKEMKNTGYFSLFFYPGGEKDSGFIVFASDDELASLNIHPFNQLIDRKYTPIPENDAGDHDERIYQMAKDLEQRRDK